MASDVDVNMTSYDYGLSSEFQELILSTYGKKLWKCESSQPKVSRSEIFTDKMSHTWRNDIKRVPSAGGDSPQQQLMDPNTMKWKAWKGSQAFYAAQDFDSFEPKPEMNRLTKAEFRKLTEQVREVGETLTKYRSAYDFRNFSNGHKSTPAVYRTQLAKSLKAFQPKHWRTYDNSSLDQSYSRCRPVTCIADRSTNPDTVRVRKGRPKSSPVSFTHTVSNRGVNDFDGTVDQFDRLTPSVVYELTDGDEPQCLYGERSFSVAGAVGTGSAASVTSSGDENDRARESQVNLVEKTDASNSKRRVIRTKKASPQRRTQKKLSSEDSICSDTSDTEQPLDPIADIIFGGKFKPPKTKYIRPEKLDDIYVPDGKKDRKKYDFDASIVHEDEYLFKNPLPTQLRTVDFRDLAEMKIPWHEGTKKRPGKKEDILFIDRLFDMECIQLLSEEWEKSRRRQVRKAQNKQVVSAMDLLRGIPPDHRAKDRKCVADCVQMACVGDCPEKKVAPSVCIVCRDKLCMGRCSQSRYDGYTRTATRCTLENAQPKEPPKRPRSCTPCSSRYNNANVINANNRVLGRPRSGFATFEHGRKSSPPKDMRPKSALSASSSSQSNAMFGSLDLTLSRPGSAKPKPVRLRGRASSSPGKSYFSQRRNSLTDHSVPRRPQSAVSNVTLKKRVKSATRRVRPKTALA